MSRDVKTGMLVGLVVVTIAVVAISMWPGAAVEDRLRMDSGRTQKQTHVPPAVPPIRPPVDNSAVDNLPVETPTTQDNIAEAARQVVEASRQQPVGPPAPRIHIVAKDENLSTIAQIHYGDANKWPLIAEANKNVLPDANRVRPGMRLLIPPLD